MKEVDYAKGILALMTVPGVVEPKLEEVRFHYFDVEENLKNRYCATRYELKVPYQKYPKNSTVSGWVRRLKEYGYITFREYDRRLIELHDLELKYAAQMEKFRKQYMWSLPPRVPVHDLYLNPFFLSVEMPKFFSRYAPYHIPDVMPIVTTIRNGEKVKYRVFIKIRPFKKDSTPPYRKISLRRFTEDLKELGWEFSGHLDLVDTPSCDIKFKHPGNDDWHWLVVSRFQPTPFTAPPPKRKEK